MNWRYILIGALVLIASGCSDGELAKQVNALKESNNGEELTTLLLERAANGETQHNSAGALWIDIEWEASDAIVAITMSDSDEHTRVERTLIRGRENPRSPGEAFVASRLLYYINRGLYEEIQQEIMQSVLDYLTANRDGPEVGLSPTSAFSARPLSRGTAVDALVSWYDSAHPNADIGNHISLAIPTGPTKAELEEFRSRVALAGVIHRRREHHGQYVGCEGSAFRYVTDLFLIDLEYGIKETAMVQGSKPPVSVASREGRNCDAAGGWPDDTDYLVLRQPSARH